MIMDHSRRMVLLDDTAASLRMIRAELASLDHGDSPVATTAPEAPRVPVQAEGRARVA